MNITVVKPSWEFIRFPDELTKYIEECGRTCYKSEDCITNDSADKFVRMICRNNHISVLEHASISVRIVCSRACSHQLVRHRIAAYSQESQRYCHYGKKGLQVICPPSIGIPEGIYEIDESNSNIYYNFPPLDGILSKLNIRQWRWLRLRALEYEEYLEELDEKIPPEDARFNLPNACKTEIATTFNCRMWRHVFQERGLNKHAQWEIRGLFKDMLTKFSTFWPTVFGDLNE